MSTPSPSAKAAAPKRAAVAAAEKHPDGPRRKSLDYQGLTLSLPAEIPAVLIFDIVEMEATSEANPVPMIRLLRSLLGPEQFTQVRHRLPVGGADWEGVNALLEQVLDAYGLSLGESTAS